MPKMFNNVKVRSFAHLNDLYVLNRFYVNDTSLVVITYILLGVWYVATSEHNPVNYVLLLLRNKHKLLNSFSVATNAFISPEKILFTPKSLYEAFSRRSWKLKVMHHLELVVWS